MNFPELEPSTLLTPRDIRALANYQAIVPTKKKGQNFLLDPNTVRMIVERAKLKPGQGVVEVGPGLGSLTLGLLEAGHKVSAVELDPLLAELLPLTLTKKGFEAGNYAIANEDALKVRQLPIPNGALNPPTALVANLPYNVATPILLTLFERFDALEKALVMVQLEVARRIAAKPGNKVYGAPSVKVAWYGQSALAGSISRQVFWPVPNVDSALVEIKRNRTPREDEPGREAVFETIDAAFAQRRKTLRAALKQWASPFAPEEVLIRAGIDPNARGETLDVDAYIQLALAREEIRGEL